MPTRNDRRTFLKQSTLAAAGLWIGGSTARASSRAANEKLNIGVVGCGGRGRGDIEGIRGENIVALCDVDERRAAQSFEEFPGARRYRDFRKMLEEQKDLDAVVVATPDHVHAPASIMSMRLGKHVYCEKPLTHSIAEARLMRETAEQYSAVTQMGQQGHASDGLRRAVEIVQGGVLGQVREVHAWTDRPVNFWPQEIDRPADTPPVPKELQWDLWLGPAPERPYNPAYLPFVWRGWWDFGTGALGDMACHVIDMAFWALRLEDPTSVEAKVSKVHPETAPNTSVITWEFAARGDLAPAKLAWYDGGLMPDAALAQGLELPGNGSLLVGDKGTMFVPHAQGSEFVLLPEERFRDVELPQPHLPRSPGHHAEWIAACKGEGQSMSNFDYASRLTETVLLGNVAIRAGKKIAWDAAGMRATNCPEADAFIQREYRAGWTI